MKINDFYILFGMLAAALIWVFSTQSTADQHMPAKMYMLKDATYVRSGYDIPSQP